MRAPTAFESFSSTVPKMATQEEIAPSPRLEAEAKTEKAEADYKVAKQKCDDLSGNAKDVSKKDA